MRILPLVALLLGMAPQDKPQEDLKKAIAKVMKQNSYRVTYKAVIKAPNSDPMVIQGTSLWVAPRVVYVEYKASGGDNKRIIRVGDKVWIYHEFVEDWVTAEEMGNQGAGRGVQNPEEVLAVLWKHARKVEKANSVMVSTRSVDQLVVTLTGPEIEKIMKEQAGQGEFDWKKSKATAKVFVDPKDNLVYKFISDAQLTSKDPAVKGTIVYNAEVEVTSYNKENSHTFMLVDARKTKKTPIPVPSGIRKAIDKLKKEGRK